MPTAQLAVWVAFVLGGSLLAQAPKVWTPQELFQRNVGTTEDPAGYKAELDLVEGVFRSTLAQQRAGQK